jgi:hypothetical protein
MAFAYVILNRTYVTRHTPLEPEGGHHGHIYPLDLEMASAA